MRRPLVVAALALAGLALTGCTFPDRRLEDRACTIDRDCLEGYACVQQRCVDEGAVADSGPADAGVRDGGATDHLVVDAAVSDVTETDATPADAATVDAGTLDSWVADAVGADAAPPDAVAADGATLDGQAEDAPAWCGEVGVTCEVAPPPQCADSTALRTYQPFGACVSGACEFVQVVTSCTVACLDGACTFCGNGVDDGEPCDDGNAASGDGCSSTCAVETGWTCTAAPSTCAGICGDGLDVGAEQCDPGAHSDSVSCNYDGGSGPLACTFVVCGDGYTNAAANEQCDDGNDDNTDACLNSCQAASCGDGHVWVGQEFCDDRNTLACGTCWADCSMSSTPQAASGTITAVTVSNLQDGETFTLDDGLHDPVVFEFDRSMPQPSTPRIRVDLMSGSTAESVAILIAQAISGVGGALEITASASVATVTLNNERPGTHGNIDITESVSNAGFAVSGMSGGAARDCLTGTGCMQNADCLSNNCVAMICQ